MGSLSNEYDNYFTPAGYAFSIWGLIYIGLIGNAIYLLRNTDKPTTKTQATGLTVANLANCTWVFLWLYEYYLPPKQSSEFLLEEDRGHLQCLYS